MVYMMTLRCRCARDVFFQFVAQSVAMVTTFYCKIFVDGTTSVVQMKVGKLDDLEV